MARTGVRVSAIIIKGDEILLMHRKKNGEEYWVFPGGGAEDNETLDEAIVREVKEETNLDVSKHKLAFMGEYGQDDKEHPFYFCEVNNVTTRITGEEKSRHNSENWYRLEWVKLSNVKDIYLVPEKATKEMLKRYS